MVRCWRWFPNPELTAEPFYHLGASLFNTHNEVEGLIAKKKYGKAIAVLREQLAVERNVFKLQQMADLLVLEGQDREALQILSRLVEEFGSQGFFTKAIAILKKIQRIKPDLAGLEERLTELVRKRSEESEPAKAEQNSEAEEISGTSLVGLSPLFRDLSDNELTAFIRGLDLQLFDPGQIVVSEGEPGHSLFVVASGTLRVYVRDLESHNTQVRLLESGEFFGEISLLTGQRRSATITCATTCELLELDISRLNAMAQFHPGIPNTIRHFARKRRNSPEERMARRGEQAS